MKSPVLHLALCAAAICSAATALAQNVTPPPLPPGSAMVRPEAGLQEAERKRYVRAHHHKVMHRKPAANAGAGGNHPAPAAPKK